VVLVDCWATWCSPCMAKMPKLKDFYEQRRRDGFEIVGVCFDQDAEKAKKALTLLGISWPQVFVPSDEPARQLWEEGTGIDGLPRLFLIDRDGILRAECNPGDLETQVARLLGDGARVPRP